MDEKNKQKAKVLIVDDEEDLTELIKLALKNDYEITSCFDGKEALFLLEKVKPDIVITDIYMPILGGLDLINEIRRISRIPIIVISGGRLTKKIPYLESKGVSSIIEKPFSVRELKTHIEAALA
ncbi:MAG: response regulator [Deltaproteobacteria bacterium]|nr:response regulator [Deltaproteobacteria bacterium]